MSIMDIVNAQKREQDRIDAFARTLTEHPMVSAESYNELRIAVSVLVDKLERLTPAPDSNPSQRIAFAKLRKGALGKIRELERTQITDLGDTMLGEEG